MVFEPFDLLPVRRVEIPDFRPEILCMILLNGMSELMDDDIVENEEWRHDQSPAELQPVVMRTPPPLRSRV